MSTITPPASLPEIASAVRALLDASVDRQDDGTPTRFELRVASRLMELMQRELEQNGAAPRAEREGLCQRIAEGEADQPLLDDLWAAALAQLAIDNPAYRWH